MGKLKKDNGGGDSEESRWNFLFHLVDWTDCEFRSIETDRDLI